MACTVLSFCCTWSHWNLEPIFILCLCKQVAYSYHQMNVAFMHGVFQVTLLTWSLFSLTPLVRRCASVRWTWWRSWTRSTQTGCASTWARQTRQDMRAIGRYLHRLTHLSKKSLSPLPQDRRHGFALRRKLVKHVWTCTWSGLAGPMVHMSRKGRLTCIYAVLISTVNKLCVFLK